MARKIQLAKSLRNTAPAFAIVLALCSSPEPPKVDPNLSPVDYRDQIVTFLTTDLQDPTNIRNAALSDPVLMQVTPEASRWAACVRYTARNNGRYGASEDRLAIFLGGRLNQIVPATPAQCGKAAYKPFPELEKICEGERCA